jgi:hypothetical protein
MEFYQTCIYLLKKGRLMITSDGTNSARTSRSVLETGRSGADTAFFLLRTVFTVAPILFGIDKFTQVMSDWDSYLAGWINDIAPGSAHDAMMIVGVIEIVAGVLVAIAPRIGGYVVALWLAGIIVDLLTLGDYFDVALRDFGLLVAALALAQLAADRPLLSRR